jgi:hypothetical protein
MNDPVTMESIGIFRRRELEQPHPRARIAIRGLNGEGGAPNARPQARKKSEVYLLEYIEDIFGRARRR